MNRILFIGRRRGREVEEKRHKLGLNSGFFV